ncbi:MAG: hypothetical protein ACTSQA_09255, partial [Candidatus Heimdallarchaeaceae archaeon]
MKRYILPLILILTLGFGGSAFSATYTSQYPPAQNDTYVKSTGKYNTTYWAYYATDPTKTLIGLYANNSWLANTLTEQRFHIDLGSAKVITRIYYENTHSDGNNTLFGAKNFTFWGSNNAAAFAELTYGTDTNWTELTVAQNTFDEHISENIADPKYIVVTNTTAYRYYAFKIADNYGTFAMGIRRIELQTEDTIPTVATQEVTDIASNSATGNGNITDTGGLNLTKRGICWNTTGNPTVADNKSEETGSFGTGAFTRPITGLDPNVQYFVKAYAYNEAGYAYGDQVDFTTDKTTPTVTIQAVSNIEATTAIGNGNITDAGGADCDKRGFVYGTTTQFDPGTTTPASSDYDSYAEDTGTFSTGAFTKGLTGLTPGTKYYIRAY